MSKFKFPDSFLWGAAISSYQTEGGNFQSDWSLWEKEKGLEKAEDACKHYQLYKEDFKIAKELNLKAIRISLEWSRINPKPDEFDEVELNHYREVLLELKRLGLKPIVTLHHFTNPLWFGQIGSWHGNQAPDFFLKYLVKTVDYLKDLVDTWVIVNEPCVFVYKGYIEASWPPGNKSYLLAKKALDNITKACIDGAQLIRNIYAKQGLTSKISIAKNMRLFNPCPLGKVKLNAYAAKLREYIFNWVILDHLVSAGALDYIGLNYYCREFVTFKGLIGAECEHTDHKGKHNQAGWYVYPQGLFEILKSLKKYNLPIIITENGTTENSDEAYGQYLKEHLISLSKAISQGVKVEGYFWWSLIDNFEWDKGFSQRFGLVEVDYSSYQRKLKPVALEYAKICQENKIEY